jgi:hypothetical protein
MKDQVKEAVAKLHAEGKGTKEISDILNMSSSLVSYYKRRLGIKRKHAQEKPTSKRKLRLASTGLSPAELTAAGLKFSRKKENSSRTNHEFTVTFDDIKWNTVCPILGIPLDYLCEGRTEGSVSFDRTDSSKGYVPGNVQIISWRANRIKNDGVLAEFEKIVTYLKNL